MVIVLILAFRANGSSCTANNTLSLRVLISHRRDISTAGNLDHGVSDVSEKERTCSLRATESRLQ